MDFICNICGTKNSVEYIESLNREFTRCSICNSSPRMRAIIHILSMELFGKSYTLPRFPIDQKIKGIGISDWEGYAELLTNKLRYLNTYYHKEPFLDIDNVPDSHKGKYDFLICSDVLEHTNPPVSRAIQGCYDLIKDDGFVIFSVPYVFEGGHREFFPNLYKYEILEMDGKKILKNLTRDGNEEIFEDLIFHGGDGSVLMTRLFSESSLMKELHQVGFTDVKIYRMYLEYGIYWPEAYSQIMALRKSSSRKFADKDAESNCIGQTTMRFQNSIVERVLPQDSRKRRYYELCIRGGRLLVNEGWSSFWWSFKNYITINVLNDFARILPQRIEEMLSSKRSEFRRKGNARISIEDIRPTTDSLNRMREECKHFEYKPKISIILPVWNTEECWLRSAIESVINQVYDNWELCIADDASSKPKVAEILKYYQNTDKRIKVIFLKENHGTAKASNEAIALSDGEFIGLLDHDDELLPSALFEVVKLLNDKMDADLIYSDEVLLNEKGLPVYAYYRPDFSIDYLLSHCYIVHFVVIRSDIIKKLGGFRTEFPVSQDYDLFLRVLSETRKFYHIPKVLYLWRQSNSSSGHVLMPKVMDLSKKALQDFLTREGIQGEACKTKYFNFFRIRRKLVGYPLISIIIPIKDNVDFLRRCIESLEEKTSYRNYEVIIVDNLSEKLETREYLDLLQERYKNYHILRFEETFNYSRLNNYAARFAEGEHILFLNNDVEIISSEWLQEMIEQSQREDIGCVGAKLLYPDGSIQHVGVIVGWGGRAEHIYKGYDSKDIGYMGHFISIRNYSAVTAACMMVKKRIFDQVSGFDENLMVGFSDTDLCLRIMELGYINIYTPYAELLHYESATRGKTFSGDSHESDTKYFVGRWGNLIRDGDPFYNPNLPLDSYDINPYVCLMKYKKFEN